MKTIYKYELNITDEQTMYAYKDAQILSVKNQDERIVVYMLVETESPVEAFTFRLVGTGNYFPDTSSYKFLNTVLMSNGLVWHIFLAGECK